jgi:hypothetical protein
MPNYRYQVRGTSGQMQAGTISAESIATASTLLRNQGLHVMAISPIAAGLDTSGWAAKFAELNAGSPTQKHVLDFTTQLAVMIRAGINIRAARGAPVRASAAGEVVYAGDQVPGFGNLVLIKHPDGWVTAYAHMSNVDVKIQQKVLQGQQIGEAGDTGGVSEPQLHFEIRYAPTPAERARPVAPTLLLPR